MREVRGAPWVVRPVRPVGFPGSRRLVTEASRRVAGRIVVVVWLVCNGDEDGELGVCGDE